MASFAILVKEQASRKEELQRILENTRKEGSRRTVDLVTARLASAKELWDDFEKTDNEMRISEHLDTTSSYFTNDEYDAAKELMQKLEKKFSEYLQEFLSKPVPKPVSKLPTESVIQVDQLNRLFDNTAGSLKTLIRSSLAEAQHAQSKAFFQCKIKMLENKWESLMKTHDELVRLGEDTNQFLDEISFEFQDIIIFFQDKLNQMEDPRISQTTREMKLPKITIPKFNGDYTSWPSFLDLFNQLVHSNQSVTNVEKMHYLKSNLSGEAERIIRHMTVCEENYDAAWNLLKARYNNKRLLINNQLQVMFNMKRVSSEASKELRQMFDKTKECLLSLQNLGVDTKSWDPIIIYMMLNKLDVESQKHYELSLKSSKEPQKLDDFFTFLEGRYQSLEVLEATQSGQQKFKSNGYKTNDQIICNFCKERHNIFSCQKFISMDVAKRNETIRDQKKCIKCFGDHLTKQCLNKSRCTKCRREHHTLLHNDDFKKKWAKPQDIEEKVVQTHALEGDENGSTALIPTAIVKVAGMNGESHLLRALIDQGSQASFITESAAQLLKIPKTKIHAKVSGLGEKDETIKNLLNINFTPRYASDYIENLDAYVMKKLTKVIPNSLVKKPKRQLENITLADPSYNVPGPIDLILGADVYPKIILADIIKGELGVPLAQNSKIGWILSGTIKTSTNHQNKLVSLVGQMDLDQQLKRFWDVEQLSQEKHPTQEEEECEQMYRNTTQRDSTGRYSVKLPFKGNGVLELGDSRKMSIATLLQLEKKFTKDPKLRDQYVTFMREYEKAGHMKQVQRVQDLTGINYLPHHAVLKEESTTTKLRVVFDAARRTNNGKNLNSVLMTGAKIQDDLLCILMRWRKHRIAMTADIEKMYRQIVVQPQDADCQRIVWREDTNRPIREYQLSTVTYGTSCAPFLAVRTLQQLARDENQRYPLASKTTLQDFYVDDVLTEADSTKDAIELKNELVQMHKSGGFNLRKWASNSQELLSTIKPEDMEVDFPLNIESTEFIKTLGIQWNPSTDRFKIKIRVNPETIIPTKRQLLSEISKPFDPLGWLAPVIVKAKIMMQQIWLTKLDWDEKIPIEVANEWLEYKNQLHQLEDLCISRWIGYNFKSKVQFHGFCDASEKAYAAAVYTRIIEKNGLITVKLLASKTKVAPVKENRLTIPKLELLAAYTLAQLMETVLLAMKIEEAEVFYWTDSTAVLGWIDQQPNNWQTFVANRVAKIQSVSTSEQWNHVSSTENPADCASRGINPSQLISQMLWWNGPLWLFNKNLEIKRKSFNTTLEKRKNIIAHVVKITEEDILLKYSGITHLKRIVGLLRRFANNVRNPKGKTVGILTGKELADAEICILRMEQSKHFHEETQALKTNRQLEKSNRLQNLNPFLDKNGIIRVGGRLQNSLTLGYNQKHPIILPPTGRITNLIMDNIHKITGHAAKSLTLATIRNKYWLMEATQFVQSSTSV